MARSPDLDEYERALRRHLIGLMVTTAKEEDPLQAAYSVPVFSATPESEADAAKDQRGVVRRMPVIAISIRDMDYDLRRTESGTLVQYEDAPEEEDGSHQATVRMPGLRAIGRTRPGAYLVDDLPRPHPYGVDDYGAVEVTPHTEGPEVTVPTSRIKRVGLSQPWMISARVTVFDRYQGRLSRQVVPFVLTRLMRGNLLTVHAYTNDVQETAEVLGKYRLHTPTGAPSFRNLDATMQATRLFRREMEVQIEAVLDLPNAALGDGEQVWTALTRHLTTRKVDGTLISAGDLDKAVAGP